MACSKNSSKRKVYSNTILPQERKKNNQIHNLTLYLKQLEKEEPKSPKSHRMKDIIKI